MTQEPKLLTEEEWRDLYGDRRLTLFIKTLRERGLIAPEPVDPLLIEAREIAASYWEGLGDYVGADDYRSGKKDSGWSGLQIALLALKRGMELAERPLTLERLEAAWTVAQYQAQENECILPYMLAALTEQVQP